MSKEQLLQELAAAFERFIEAAREAAERGPAHRESTWGAREVAAHLAGWEVMASVRVPRTAAGMAPLEFADEAQQDAMNDAINATIVAMIGDQAFDAVCAILRRAYQNDIEMLKGL